MAWFRPFRGLRFHESAGDPSDLVALPSIGLTTTDREKFSRKSPLNIVHVASPEGKADDRSRFIRYARSAATLSEWRRNGSLTFDSAPCLYVVNAKIVSPEAKVSSANWLIGLMDLGDENEPQNLVNVSRPVWEGQLRLLETTQTQVEPALGTVSALPARLLDLMAAPTAGSTLVEAHLDGVRYELSTLSLEDHERLDLDIEITTENALRAAIEFRSEQSEGRKTEAGQFILVAVQILQDMSGTPSFDLEKLPNIDKSTPSALPVLPSGLILWSHNSI